MKHDPANHKKAPPHPDYPNGYHIQPHEATRADFPHQRNVVVLLAKPHLDENYEVFHKPIPAHLKGRKHTHAGKDLDIHWINNFGLKKQGSSDYADAVHKYNVILDHIEGAHYVFFDGSAIRDLPVNPHSPGKVIAELEIGDPPLGWGG